jgi:AraC-like DNA-binding protein
VHRGAAVPTSLVEVLWTARYDYQPDWRLAEHKHKYFQMIYVVSGTARVSLGQDHHRVGTGALVLIKPLCVHGLEPVSLVKTLDIKFIVKDRSLRGLLRDCSDIVANCEGGVADLFERIRREGERKDPYYRDLCSALLVELLLVYLRAASNGKTTRAGESLAPEPPLSDSIAQQAARFIRDHHTEDFSLLDLAKVIGHSDRHVRQHFKDALGISPRRYLLQYRIQRAQQLIEFSGFALKEVAGIVGFKTVHHFTRAFHDVCGETPGGWRRKYQAGICKDVNIDPGFVNTNWTVRLEASQHKHAPN